MKISQNRSGFSTLPIVMAMLLLIIAITTGISAITVSEILITEGYNQSSQAYRYAQAGAQDALIKLTRNYTYACSSVDCYQVDLAPPSGCGVSLDGCARIQVTNTVSPAIIIAKGLVKNKTRTLQVDVTYNADGQITGTVWKELTT